ncbi:MAG: ATP-dependent helicase C-terminal domain-containing protein, partial [Microthrixaceae bacterium]
ITEHPRWLAEYLVSAAGATGRGDSGTCRRLAADAGLVSGAFSSRMTFDDMRVLDSEAPRHWTAPDGRELRLHYGAVDGDPASVSLSCRLQYLLGVDDHPTIGHRRIPVAVELLSPAGRPLQRTTDLPGFWRGSYAQVRAEMRGRYRKHNWPERPWEGLP